MTQMAALHAQGSPSRAIIQPGWRCKCLYTGSSYLCPSSPRPLLQCFPDEARTRPRWAAAWRSVCEGDGWEHAHLRKQMSTSEGEQREQKNRFGGYACGGLLSICKLVAPTTDSNLPCPLGCTLLRGLDGWDPSQIMVFFSVAKFSTSGRKHLSTSNIRLAL